MDQRIRFVTHDGKQILIVDLSNCAAREVEQIARTVPNYVTAQPRGSVLVLADFTGASIDVGSHSGNEEECSLRQAVH